jgi:hypothetical protein
MYVDSHQKLFDHSERLRQIGIDYLNENENVFQYLLHLFLDAQMLQDDALLQGNFLIQFCLKISKS